MQVPVDNIVSMKCMALGKRRRWYRRSGNNAIKVIRIRLYGFETLSSASAAA